MPQLFAETVRNISARYLASIDRCPYNHEPMDYSHFVRSQSPQKWLKVVWSVVYWVCAKGIYFAIVIVPAVLLLILFLA
jgi:hypothetical protein